MMGWALTHYVDSMASIKILEFKYNTGIRPKLNMSNLNVYRMKKVKHTLKDIDSKPALIGIFVFPSLICFVLKKLDI
jgi:hypothetical protein